MRRPRDQIPPTCDKAMVPHTSSRPENRYVYFGLLSAVIDSTVCRKYDNTAAMYDIVTSRQDHEHRA